MAAIQLAQSRCRGRLSGDYDTDIQNLRDMEQLGSMGAELAWVMEYLRGGLTPGQLARQAKEAAVPVASIPDRARPAIPAGMGHIRGKLEVLKKLPARQKEVYILVEGQGMNAAEAAEVMHISRQAAATHLTRARAAIGRLQESKEEARQISI